MRARSYLIDGEAVCCDEHGLARFDVLRNRRNEVDAFLYAPDLLELDGTDLRREPIEVRKMPPLKGSSCSRTPAAWATRDFLEAPRVSLPVGAIARLAQVQEPGGARRREAEKDWGR